MADLGSINWDELPNLDDILSDDILALGSEVQHEQAQADSPMDLFTDVCALQSQSALFHLTPSSKAAGQSLATTPSSAGSNATTTSSRQIGKVARRRSRTAGQEGPRMKPIIGHVQLNYHYPAIRQEEWLAIFNPDDRTRFLLDGRFVRPTSEAEMRRDDEIRDAITHKAVRKQLKATMPHMVAFIEKFHTAVVNRNSKAAKIQPAA